MSDVRFLKPKEATPHGIAASLAERVQKGGIKSLYVVALDENDEPILWEAGNLGDLCYITQCLQSECTVRIQGLDKT